jgi:hypothetical protein
MTNLECNDDSSLTTTGSKKEPQNQANNYEVNNDDKVVTILYPLPRTLILKASFDMGLQESGKLMVDVIEQHTIVKYKHISWTDHASMNWNEKDILRYVGAYGFGVI